MTREYINPPGVFKHTHYTRVLTIEKPSKLIYIAGQTPADDKYQPVHPGDVRAQYIAVLEGLTLQLKAGGASWENVVFRRMYAVDVPAFLKVMNDPTGPVAMGQESPLPQHDDRRNSPIKSRFSDRGGDCRRGRELGGRKALLTAPAVHPGHFHRPANFRCGNERWRSSL
jgi:enamine deaminase RidA (YjgF/YER057c/UK114 family)